MDIIFTDNFTRANANPVGAPWTTVTGLNAVQLVGNLLRATATGVHSTIRYGAFTIADMKSTVTMTTHTAANCQMDVSVRQSATAWTNYNLTQGGEWQLNKAVGGSFTQLSGQITSGNTPASGQTAGIQAVGTTIKGYEDGVEILSQTDSAILTGTWGLRIVAGSSVADEELDDFVGEAFEPFFVIAGTEGAAISGNITPGIPGGTNPQALLVNDILIMAYHGSDNVAVTVDGAWTQIVQANGGSTASRLGVWWHRYDGSTPPSALITHTAGNNPIAGIAAFRNCETSGTPLVAGSIGTGTDATIEHTTVTPTGPASALLLAINGAADDNDRTLLSGYLNVFAEGAINAYLNALGNPDGSISMFYKPVPISATGTVTVTQAAADPWASVLVALQQAAAAPTPITIPSLADDLGSYADAIAKELRGPPRWNDSLAFTKADVGTTLIPVNFSADGLGSYADAPTLRLAFLAAPAADSMAMADQAPTISFALNVAFTDSLGLYADQTPTIVFQGILTAAPAADALVYADAINGFFTYAARPSDDLNQWTDQRTVSTGTGAYQADLPADSLNNWADSQTNRLGEFVAPAADSMAQADQLAVIAGRLASLAADAMSAADQLAGALNYLAQLSDALPSYVDQLSFSQIPQKSATLTDAFPSYTDQLSFAQITLKSATFSDALGSYSDTIAGFRAIRVTLSDTFTWADQVATTGMIRQGWLDSAVVTTLPVRVGWLDSVVVFRTTGQDRIVTLTSIKPVPLDNYSLTLGYRYGDIVYLVDEGGNFIVDENGNRILISGGGLSDGLSTPVDSVAVTRTAQGLTPILVTFTDALPAYVDSLQAIRGIYTLTASFVDALPPYAEIFQFIYTGTLSGSLSDALGSYADAIGMSTSGGYSVPLSDALPASVDSIQVRQIGFLQVSLSDALGGYADTAAVNTVGGLFYPALADSFEPYSDQLNLQGGQIGSLIDAVPPITDAVAINLVGILKATPTDNLAAYVDTIAPQRGLFYSTPADTLANYLDAATRGGLGQLQAALVDNLNQYADSPATFANLRAQASDDLAYADSLAALLGLSIARTDGLFLGVRSPDALDSRLGSIDELRCEFSDNLNQWADALLFSRVYFAIRLSGNVTERITLTGKLLEEQIGLNGKVEDKADISGELYIGE